MRTLGERLNGLRWRLRATRRLWSRGMSPEMPFLEPEPIHTAASGEIDCPRPGERIEDEMLLVRGWALFPSTPTSRVEAWLGDAPLARARLAIERPDLEHHSGLAAARLGGFELTVEVEALPAASGELPLRVVATSADGERLQLGPVPVTVGPAGGEAEPPANGSDARPPELPLPPPETPLPAAGDGPPLLVYTHQLNLGGAQLYLMDLLRELIAQGRARPTVVTAIDGILRAELEGLGVPVHVSSPPPMDDVASYAGRAEELASWAAGRDFEAVLINTATGLVLPGAEMAERLGIPAVWAIHESFPLSVLWQGADPAVRERAERALGRAALALFEAEATRLMFEDRIGEGRGVVVPYGVDFGPLDAARAGFDRGAARREAGIPDDAELVLCVGTVEPRKAQVQLAQAFDLIAARHPRARLVFVGVADTPASDLLVGAAERAAARERIELIGITPDVERWYGMADLLVSASDVESLPRTVLEAMAWETPVLATDVFGLPELIDDGETGWLCEPRDTLALANGLDRALAASPEERQRIARAARELVVDRHSLPRYAAAVADLLEKAASETRSEAGATG
jgi:D-inositol-3-phosphate glycosyltransferase